MMRKMTWLGRPSGRWKNAARWSATAGATVAAAVAEMNRRQIGSLVVMDTGYIAGIFTERDVLARVVASSLDPKLTPVRDVMTTRLLSISDDASIEDVMQIMKEYRIRHVPVLNNNQLLGILSISDINIWLLKASEIEAENLRRYIFEAYPC